MGGHSSHSKVIIEMAAYLRQGDQVALMFYKAEAEALRDLALYADQDDEKPKNASTAAAAERALEAISRACNHSAMSAGKIFT